MPYINIVTLDYPLSFADIRAAHPATSFTAPPNASELIEFGYAEVQPTAPPDLAADEVLIETDPGLAEGVWVQQWSSRPATDLELLARCDYIAFWNALLTSEVYQSIRAQACVDLGVNVCCTEFVAAIGDAKAGRANKNAIQACITLLLQEVQLTADELSELSDVLSAGNLQYVYTLG